MKINKIFHEATVKMTKMKIAESSGDLDKRLDMLVSSANEIRSAWTTSESRCVEWIGLFLTEINLDTNRKEIINSIVKSESISSAANLWKQLNHYFRPRKLNGNH